MRRRQYLAASAALLAGPLAGCAHPNAVLTLEEVSDAELADRASRNVSRNPEARSIVSRTVEDGSANATGRSPPLDTDAPVEYDGRYYDLSATETGQRETTEYDIRIDYDHGTATVAGDAIEYENLPAVDRTALDALLPPMEEPPENEGYDFGVGRAYSDAETDASVLVPDQEYDAVVYDGKRYPIDVGDGRTVSLYDYRYEAEEIAAAATEFAESVRSEYLFTLSGLSDAEREVVAEATGDGYYEGSANDAFTSVARRFREHRGIDTDEWGGNWVVRYEGTVYWADLRHPTSAMEE